MNRRRINVRWLLQTLALVAGLATMAFVAGRTLDSARHRVMPSFWAILIAGGLTLLGLVASGRAWAVLFSGHLGSRRDRSRMAGAFYLSQLTKYLPAGGAVQAASQVNLAAATGVPIGRVALAFPVLAAAIVAAGCTLGAGLVFDSDLAGWARAMSLVGLAVPLILYRPLLDVLLALARRVVGRLPGPEALPTQGSICVSYVLALVNLAAYSAAYVVLLRSLSDDVDVATGLFAFALSWVVGFLVLPLPAGVGVREAMLVATIPGLGAAPLLAASLAHRLLSIGAELGVAMGNRVVVHWIGRTDDRHLQAPRPRAAGRGTSAPPCEVSTPRVSDHTPSIQDLEDGR